jgi:hypothetical protein
MKLVLKNTSWHKNHYDLGCSRVYKKALLILLALIGLIQTPSYGDILVELDNSYMKPAETLVFREVGLATTFNCNLSPNPAQHKKSLCQLSLKTNVYYEIEMYNGLNYKIGKCGPLVFHHPGETVDLKIQADGKCQAVIKN